MKHILSIIAGILFMSALTVNASAFDKSEFIPFGDKDLSAKLQSKIRSLGGYQEWCVELTIKNITTETLKIRLEAGRRLVAVESKFQDILIILDQYITISPNGSETVKGYGYCCEAYDGAPILNCQFELGYMAPAPWLKVIKVINKYKFSTYQIQAAVWALSNSYSVNNIGNGTLPVDELKKAVVEANPESNSPAINYGSHPMTAQDSIDWMNRLEIQIRNQTNWHPIGVKDVYQYNYVDVRKGNQWKPVKGSMTIDGRYIILTDSVNSQNNLKLLMGEVKKDTLNLGEGRIIASDLVIVDRVDVNGDRNHYMFKFMHDLDTGIYSITMTGWNSSAPMFIIRVKPKEGL